MDYILSRLLFLPGILLGISIHEFSHGYAAVKMGDNTPLMQGRLTLNPVKHIDPMGFVCLLLFGFGYHFLRHIQNHASRPICIRIPFNARF